MTELIRIDLIGIYPMLLRQELNRKLLNAARISARLQIPKDAIYADTDGYYVIRDRKLEFIKFTE